MPERTGVVKFSNGPEKFLLWGDRVEVDYALVSSDQEGTEPGEVAIYVYPYRLVVDAAELENVTDDEFEEFPDDFAPGWDWWYDLDDDKKEDCIGPVWIEYLGGNNEN